MSEKSDIKNVSKHDNNMDVLNKLIAPLTDASLHIRLALTDGETDWFLKHVEGAKNDIEILIEYVKLHEKDVSATLSRIKIKEASNHLQRALSILEDAVNSSSGYEFQKTVLMKHIQSSKNMLKSS